MSENPEYKLIITGDQEFDNYEHLSRVLFAMADVEFADRNLSIVTTMASKTDKLGRIFAKEHHLLSYPFLTGWITEGKDTLAKQVRRMAESSDALLVFANYQPEYVRLLRRAMQRLNKPVHIINY